MTLITRTTTILFIGLSLLTAETLPGAWKFGIRGLGGDLPNARAPDPDIANRGVPLRGQDPETTKRKNLEKRFQSLTAEWQRLIQESLYLTEKLGSLQPGTRQYRDVEAALAAVNTRKARISRERERLRKQLFPCGEWYQRQYQSKFVLTVINESSLRARVFGTDEQYGVLYGEVAPGNEADLRLATDTITRFKGVEAFLAKVVVSYPDGAVIPAAAGVKTSLKKYYRVVYPTKDPCITYYRLILTDSDFSVSRAIPEQTGFSIYMNHTVYNGRVISGGARNDLTVYFMGNPKWPVTGELTAVKCPPHMNCIAVSQKFDSSSIKGRNVVVMKKAIFCYGLRKSESIPFEVRLKDSAGNTTAPSPVMLHCIVR